MLYTRFMRGRVHRGGFDAGCRRRGGYVKQAGACASLVRRPSVAVQALEGTTSCCEGVVVRISGGRGRIVGLREAAVFVCQEWWCRRICGSSRARLRAHAYTMRGMAVPPLPPPTSAPLITSAISPLLAWRGVAMAASYTVQRAVARAGPWTTICDACATDMDTPWRGYHPTNRYPEWHHCILPSARQRWR